MKLKLCLVAVLCVCSNFALAESLAGALNKCSQVENSLKRLVCYDKLNQQAKGYKDSKLPTGIRSGNNYQAGNYQPKNSNQAAAPAGTPTNNMASAEDKFGLPLIQLVEKDQATSLTAQVREVKKTPRGKLIITLENGQIWKQTDSDRLLLRAGDSVNIERGLLGAFFLKTAAGTSRIKVKRSS